jgi:hypothetical protein
VSREDFRRELRDGFESIAGPPDAGLPGRVHAALVESPERRGPVWIAGLAAALIAALVVAAFFVMGPLRQQQNIPSGVLPSPTPLPSTFSNLPPWTCTSTYFYTTPGQGPAVAYVDVVRTGTHAGYDRITVEFNNGVPGDIRLTTQDNTTFTQGASGRLLTLQGSAGLLVTIDGADEHTDYSGSTDFVTGYPVLQEARQVQDFEGVVQWGLGLSHSACYRAFFLENPWRLVIDVQTS